jgi:hypothetical protein
MSRPLRTGLEKTLFKQKNSPMGSFGFFWFFWGFLGFFGLFWVILGYFGFFLTFLYVCPEERV